MRTSKVCGVVLAGGQSARLFPFNKVVSDLTGSGKSLLREAYDRLRPMAPNGRWVLASSSMVPAIKRDLKVPASRILADPVRRGTWPALLWAMAHIRREDPEALLAVVTGDHVIQGEGAFRAAVHQALAQAAEKPAIVMLGIPPSEDPESWRGFGCLRVEPSGRLSGFEEKPSAEQARRMIREVGWRWNSGMFFFRLKVAEEALRRLAPEMNRVYEVVAENIARGKKSEAAFFFADFPDKIPHPLDPGRYVDNSIDYAIMMPLVSRKMPDLYGAAVTDTRFRWLDLGQWSALRTILKADRKGNVTLGRVRLGRDVRDCIVAAGRRERVDVQSGAGLVAAFTDRKALVIAADQLFRVKEIAQECLKHPDRLVIEHDLVDCDLQAAGGQIAAAHLSGLAIRLSRRRLTIAPKR